MTEVYEHNPLDHEDPLPGPTWMVGFIGVVLLVVVVLGITALYYGAKQEDEIVKVVEAEPIELLVMRAQQSEQLHVTRWEEREEVDAEGNPERVRALVIPIDRAMEIVAGEHAK